MRQKPPSCDALYRAIAPAIAALLVGLCASAPLRAQAQTPPSSRQLQQLETVRAWPASAKRFALVIGVDQYSDTQITTLGGASNDAKSLAETLVRYAGFPKDQVTLLASDQPAERQPTRGNILRRLSNLAAVVPQDGLLLVSFAGHGMERSGQAFLLPADAQVSNDVDLLEQTAINVTQVKERIRKTGVSQVVLILDACRNDPVGRADADNPLTLSYTRAFNFDVRNREVEAFATIYATAVGHRAYEYKEKRQGYFTWELVEGLKGGAANEKGEVTLAGLVKYLQERVPRHVLLDLGSGKDQRPFAVVEGYRADELVLAVVNPTAANGASLTPAPFDPAAIELSYWETIKNSKDEKDFAAYLEKYPNGQFTSLARNRLSNLTTSAEARPKASVRGPKSGRVLILDAIKMPGDLSENAGLYYTQLTAPLSEMLVKNNLSAATLRHEKTDITGWLMITSLVKKLRDGHKSAGRSIPFALVLDIDITVTERQPYNGLYVNEAQGKIEAIDTNDGRVLAIERINGVRGFGNTQEQAKGDTLKNVGEGISQSFIKLVAANAR